MPFLVRSRNEGRTYELRVKHSRLPKPVYHTFDVHEDAQRAGLQALAALDRGETPPWLQRSERRALITITQAILAYRAIRAVPPSTQRLLDTLITDVGSRTLTDVDYTGAEAWIRALKLEKRLAPGSIRKRKGRCLTSSTGSSAHIQRAWAAIRWTNFLTGTQATTNIPGRLSLNRAPIYQATLSEIAVSIRRKSVASWRSSSNVPSLHRPCRSKRRQRD